MARPAREPRERGSLHYGKPALSLDDLVDRLAQRGLEIPDTDRALRYLRHIGYYRLSPYTIPFQQRDTDHHFRRGAAFDDVLDVYAFDRALRLLVMDALERVEVAVRAALTDHMSTTYRDPHWYADPSHFHNDRKHSGLLRIVRDTSAHKLLSIPEPASLLPTEAAESERTEAGLLYRSALEHYLITYRTPELPPSWLVVESLTIGQLHSTIQNLRRRTDKTAVAKSIGINEPLLDSWLRTYVRVRNICAHHGRLWNVGLGVYPAIPSAPSISWLKGAGAMPDRSRRRLYPVLISLQALLDAVSPRSSWAERLHTLLLTRPSMNLVAMGVPDRWADDEFWARHLESSDQR